MTTRTVWSLCETFSMLCAIVWAVLDLVSGTPHTAQLTFSWVMAGYCRLRIMSAKSDIVSTHSNT